MFKRDLKKNKTIFLFLTVLFFHIRVFSAQINLDYDQAIENWIKELPVDSRASIESNVEFRQAIKRYAQFLHFKNDQTLKKYLFIFGKSSLRFLQCSSDDWYCLENAPSLITSVPQRREAEAKLGEPVFLNENLNMEFYLTRQWARLARNEKLRSKSMAEVFSEKILAHASSGLDLAVYGMDEIDGSMKSVFESIQKLKESKVKVRAVVDVAADTNPNGFFRSYDVVEENKKYQIINRSISEFNFSYIQPSQDQNLWAFGRPTWMDEIRGIDPQNFPMTTFGLDAMWLSKMPLAKKSTRMPFQYKDTLSLLSLLNQNIESDDQSLGRIEFPMRGIMHNKFAILKDGEEMSVWTGTTNLSNTCMGKELNSNISLFIKNKAIAQVFEDEFNEMFEYDPENLKLKSEVPTLKTGRFHNLKRPNTQRYFTFRDGTEMRIHFSPTDDGQHRSIIPFINSARKGDTLRVSMFGSGGLEEVRAFQAASARGVKVVIVLDRMTAAGGYSWINHPEGNLLEDNPYAFEGIQPVPISVRLSGWAGLNHHKTATLTRADGRVEQVIVGSQNWSYQGNNINDENMITLRKKTGSLIVGAAFNRQFDNDMVPLSAPVQRVNLTQ